jgi:hypothetical protein
VDDIDAPPPAASATTTSDAKKVPRNEGHHSHTPKPAASSVFDEQY